MSLKTYVNKDILAQVERVKESSSEVSPVYFTTSLTRPTALSRNLLSLEGVQQEFDIAVAPLKLPLTHSTGNPLNSRSFNYEYLISNPTDTLRKNFFILDTGSSCWELEFKTKLDSTTYAFLVKEFYVNDVEGDTSNLSFKLLNTSNIVRNLKSYVDNSRTDAYAIDYYETNYDIYISESTEFVADPNSSTGERAVTTLVVETSRPLSDKEASELRSTNILVGFSSSDYKSEISFFNKLTYEPTTDDYYIYNSSLRFDNINSYVRSNNIPHSPAYAGSLGKEEALFFDVNLVSIDDTDFTQNLSFLDTSLGKSSVVLSDDPLGFSGFIEMYYEVKGDGVIEGVEILRSAYSNEDDDDPDVYTFDVIAQKNTQDITTDWYTFFKNYGITCLPSYKETIFEKETTVEEETVVEEEVTYTLTGLFFKVRRSVDDEYFLRISSTSEGTATLYAECSVDSLESKINEGQLGIPFNSVVTSSDNLVKTYKIGYQDPTNKINSLSTLELTNDLEEYELQFADATGLNKENYTVESVNISYERTPFFNLGKGLTTNINRIANALVNINPNLIVSSSPYYSYLTLQNASNTLKTIYVKLSAPGCVQSTDLQTVQTSNEILFETESAEVFQETHEDVQRVPYLLVDLYNLKRLQIDPFSYLSKDGSLYRQQSSMVINYTQNISDPDLNYSATSVDLCTSLLSQFLLPITPLYTEEGELADCVAIFYDPSTIENVALYNALCLVDSVSVIDEGVTAIFKYRSGFDRALPQFTNISAAPNTSSVDFKKTVDISSTSPQGVVGSYFEYSFDTAYDVTLDLLDYSGALLETITFDSRVSQALGDTLDASALTILDITEVASDILKISVKSNAQFPRYSVRITNTLGGAITQSSLVHDVNTKVQIVPLNRS